MRMQTVRIVNADGREMVVNESDLAAHQAAGWRVKTLAAAPASLTEKRKAKAKQN